MKKAGRAKQGGGVLPFILGGAVFTFFFLGLQTGAVVSLILAIAAVMGGFLLTTPGPRRRIPNGWGSGITRESYELALHQGAESIRRIRAQAALIRNPGVAEKVRRIGETTDKILAEVRRDPNDLKHARQFLSYYLEATLKIIGKYVEMTEHGESLPKVGKSLRKVEDALDTIDTAFRRQLTKLLENDVLDLDTELALLKKTIQMEGLGGELCDEK